MIMERNFILHHYDISPFSEKIRAMLGYAGVDWQSVKVPAQPPRRSLDPVLDGYRRIPVAQVGADFYCDTKIIASEIARLSGRLELAPEKLSDPDIVYAAYLEDEIFQTCIAALPNSAMLRGLIRFLGFGMFSFIRDRTRLARAEGLGQIPKQEAQEKWQAHLVDLNARVGDRFLGGELPNAVDFAAYHLVWFYEMITGQQAVGLDALNRWKGEVEAFRGSAQVELSVQQSLALARASDPADVDAVGATDGLVGKSVGIAPTDFARNETRGVLLASTPDRWIVERSLDGSPVHVHFPKAGFEIRS